MDSKQQTRRIDESSPRHEGYTTVVDIDLENFFDRVNHDVLLNRLGRHVGDKRMLKMIGRLQGLGVPANRGWLVALSGAGDAAARESSRRSPT